MPPQGGFVPYNQPLTPSPPPSPSSGGFIPYNQPLTQKPYQSVDLGPSDRGLNQVGDWLATTALRTIPAAGAVALGTVLGPATVGSALVGGAGLGFFGGYGGELAAQKYLGQEPNRKLAMIEGLGTSIGSLYNPIRPLAGAGLGQITKYAGKTAGVNALEEGAMSIPRHIAETGKFELPSLGEAASQAAGGGLFGGLFGMGEGRLASAGAFNHLHSPQYSPSIRQGPQLGPEPVQPRLEGFTDLDGLGSLYNTRNTQRGLYEPESVQPNVWDSTTAPTPTGDPNQGSLNFTHYTQPGSKKQVPIQSLQNQDPNMFGGILGPQVGEVQPPGPPQAWSTPDRAFLPYTDQPTQGAMDLGPPPSMEQLAPPRAQSAQAASAQTSPFGPDIAVERGNEVVILQPSQQVRGYYQSQGFVPSGRVTQGNDGLPAGRPILVKGTPSSITPPTAPPPTHPAYPQGAVPHREREDIEVDAADVTDDVTAQLAEEGYRLTPTTNPLRALFKYVGDSSDTGSVSLGMLDPRQWLGGRQTQNPPDAGSGGGPSRRLPINPGRGRPISHVLRDLQAVVGQNVPQRDELLEELETSILDEANPNMAGNNYDRLDREVGYIRSYGSMGDDYYNQLFQPILDAARNHARMLGDPNTTGATQRQVMDRKNIQNATPENINTLILDWEDKIRRGANDPYGHERNMLELAHAKAESLGVVDNMSDYSLPFGELQPLNRSRLDMSAARNDPNHPFWTESNEFPYRRGTPAPPQATKEMAPSILAPTQNRTMLTEPTDLRPTLNQADVTRMQQFLSEIGSGGAGMFTKNRRWNSFAQDTLSSAGRGQPGLSIERNDWYGTSLDTEMPWRDPNRPSSGEEPFKIVYRDANGNPLAVSKGRRYADGHGEIDSLASHPSQTKEVNLALASVLTKSLEIGANRPSGATSHDTNRLIRSAVRDYNKKKNRLVEQAGKTSWSEGWKSDPMKVLFGSDDTGSIDMRMFDPRQWMRRNENAPDRTGGGGRAGTSMRNGVDLTEYLDHLVSRATRGDSTDNEMRELTDIISMETDPSTIIANYDLLDTLYSTLRNTSPRAANLTRRLLDEARTIRSTVTATQAAPSTSAIPTLSTPAPRLNRAAGITPNRRSWNQVVDGIVSDIYDGDDPGMTGSALRVTDHINRVTDFGHISNIVSDLESRVDNAPNATEMMIWEQLLFDAQARQQAMTSYGSGPATGATTGRSVDDILRDIEPDIDSSDINQTGHRTANLMAELFDRVTNERDPINAAAHLNTLESQLQHVRNTGTNTPDHYNRLFQPYIDAARNTLNSLQTGAAPIGGTPRLPRARTPVAPSFPERAGETPLPFEEAPTHLLPYKELAETAGTDKWDRFWDDPRNFSAERGPGRPTQGRWQDPAKAPLTDPGQMRGLLPRPGRENAKNSDLKIPLTNADVKAMEEYLSFRDRNIQYNTQTGEPLVPGIRSEFDVDAQEEATWSSFADQMVYSHRDGPPGLELKVDGDYGSEQHFKIVFRGEDGKPHAAASGYISPDGKGGISGLGTERRIAKSKSAYATARVLQKAIEIGANRPSGDFSNSNYTNRLVRNAVRSWKDGLDNLRNQVGGSIDPEWSAKHGVWSDPDMLMADNTPVRLNSDPKPPSGSRWGSDTGAVSLAMLDPREWAKGAGWGKGAPPPKVKKKDQKPSWIEEAIALPIAATTTGDFSSIGRQLLPMLHTRAFRHGLAPALKTLIPGERGRRAQQESLDRIKSHPLFTRTRSGATINPSFADQAGIGILDNNTPIHKREEAFMSKWVETGGSIPYLSAALRNTILAPGRGTNRFHKTLLNEVRSGALIDLAEGMRVMAEEAELSGFMRAGLRKKAVTPEEARIEDPFKNPVRARELGDYINTATGRGPMKTHVIPHQSWEVDFEKYAEGAWKIFFSPRMIASRVRMLNPSTYAMASPHIRKQYMKSMLTSLGAWGTMATLGMIGGADVETDPTSADFGKIRVGDTRLDPGGSFQQYIVATARALMGGYTSSKSGTWHRFGSGYQAETSKDMEERFWVNKMNPLMKYIYDLRDASEYKPFHLGDRTAQLFVPLAYQDAIELWKENPELLGWMIPIMMGVGTQTYEKGESVGKLIPPEWDYLNTGGGPMDLTPWSRNQ